MSIWEESLSKYDGADSVFRRNGCKTHGDVRDMREKDPEQYQTILKMAYLEGSWGGYFDPVSIYTAFDNDIEPMTFSGDV